MKKGVVFIEDRYISADIKKGDFFNKDNIRIIRPGDGAPPISMNL